MREIKFRAFQDGKMFEVGAYELGPFLEDGVAPVMQFTGLKDKSRKAGLYENDLVKSDDGKIRQVCWINAAFHAVPVPFSFDSSGKDHILLGTTDWELLGNIHENPDLLEEKS